MCSPPGNVPVVSPSVPFYPDPAWQDPAAGPPNITSGKLAPGAQLPSEKDITDLTGASRWAVRHAVAELRDRGLVRTLAHLGTFVAERNSE